jgi:ribosome-associated translation inhibitor RaiA
LDSTTKEKPVQIQVTTDNHIDGGQEFSQQVEATVEAALGRFRERLTRVTVHLTDENSHKSSADDKRCAMEARAAGLKPLAVTHLAATLDEAIDGAADKLERVLDHAFGRIEDSKDRVSMSGD